MKKFMFIVILFSVTIYISYKYSARVYISYLKYYYNKMYTETELYSRAQKMYDQKEYEDLERFLNPVMIIYPENHEFKKLAAYNYLMLGDAMQGAELFAVLPLKSIEENRNLEEILKNLYYNGHYGDLLYFYDRGIMLKNVNTALYYGIALFKQGRFDESYKMLLFVKDNTFMLPELSFYLGLNLDKKGKFQESLAYLKSAYESDRFNQSYKKALIDGYRKAGLFKDAEVLLRGR